MTNTTHQTGLTRLFARLQTKATATVTYNRRGGSSVAVEAVPGSAEHQGSDEFGFPLLTDSRSFVCEYADISGVLTGSGEPERGDTITHDGVTYEVLPQGSGKTVWDWSGPGRVLIRIYTDKGAVV